MLLARVITGVILLILAFAGIIYLPSSGYIGVTFLLVALAAFEYANLFWLANLKKKMLFLTFLLLFALLLYFASPILILAVGVLWWLVVPYILWVYSRDQKIIFVDTIWQWLVGLLVFVPCLLGLIILREKFGISYLFYVLFLVWAADIGAYFAGLWFGKHLLAPAISPKKTVEGLIGGIVIAMLVAIIGGLVLKISGIHWLFMLTLALITCLWSVIGDLFESMLKRGANVKDSGTIFPGHGGVFDRIDSLTAAIPIFTIGLFMMY